MMWIAAGSVLPRKSSVMDSLQSVVIQFGAWVGVNFCPKNLACSSGTLHKAERVMGCYIRLSVLWDVPQGSAYYGVL
jgi:hypothetical protein